MRSGLSPVLIPLSLRAKLLLFGMALQLGVLAVLALSIPMMVEPHFRAEQAADTQRFKSMVSAALALAIASGDDASVTAVLQHSRADQDLAYIAVYGTNGQLIAGDAAPSTGAAKAGPFEAVSSAISLDGLALGELRFALSGSELERVHQAFLRGLAWLSLLTLALFSPLLWWASARLSRPVRALLTASRDIRAGNYDIDVKPGSADDIGALQASFIRMSAEIRRKVSELTHSEALQRRYLRQALDQRGELVNALQRAEAASTVKTEFLAHVSHEIRTPLNAILGFSQLLQSAPLQGQHRDYLGSLEVAGQTLLDAINNLLDYAKLEDSTLVLVHQPFVLTELLKDLDRQFGAQARAKGLLLHTRLGTGLPPGFVGDAQRLRQILAILVGNAIKFTDLGEVLIDATCAEPGSATVSLKISVCDTGIGLSEEQLRHIFSPFVQGDTSNTRRYGGIGLGLSICRSLLALMGGEITAISRPGAGSNFYFTLDLPVASGSLAPAVAAADPAPLRGRKVLVVEDNPVNALVARALLEELGLQVTGAGDAQEALQQILVDRFDLVLMDLKLPGIDGLEASRRLLMQLGALAPPVIALSAADGPEVQQACLAAGMVACLSKPIRREVLASALLKWLPVPPAEPSGSVEPQPVQPVQFDIDRDRLRTALRLLERLLSHNLLSARHQLLAIEPMLGEGAAKTAFEPVAQATRALRFKTARVALDQFSELLGPEPGQA